MDMEKVFGYLKDLAKNLEDHADIFDEQRIWDRTRARESVQMVHGIMELHEDIAKTKVIVADNDELIKKTVHNNDQRFRAEVKTAIDEVWEFTRRNNLGLSTIFAKADEDIKELNEKREATEKEIRKVREHCDSATAAASSSPAASLPFNPPGLANFSKLKGDLKEDFERFNESYANKLAILEGQVESLSGLQCPCMTDQCPCLARQSSKDKGPCGTCGEADGRAQGGGVEGQVDPWWQAFQSPGPRRGKAPEPSGGGAGGGGGGGDAPGTTAFNIGTPLRPNIGPKKLRQVEYGKLFEVKDAKSLPVFNGKERGAYWHKKITFYLAS